MMPTHDGRFENLFSKWASRVRGRLALRSALTGAAFGLVVGLGVATVAWQARRGELRPYAAALGAVGAAVGLVASRKRRWSDEDVALYLDGQLASDEAIATAVDLRGRDKPARDAEGDAARAVVLDSATSALQRAKPKDARPAIFKPVHAALPIALAGLVFVARMPLPKAPALPPSPGVDTVQVAEAEGLEKVGKLAKLNARDQAQRERLDKLAKEAEKLKEDLSHGLEHRAAQDRLGRLREGLAAERLSLGEGEQRAGLESAVDKLNESDATKDAARDLGDRDLGALDDKMERLANEREQKDRALAKQKLSEAADAANKAGAPDVAKALEAEKKAFEKREKRAEMLRDLSDAMKSEGAADAQTERDRESLDRKGSDEAARKLAESMAEALEKLTPEQRKRLADKLKQKAREGGSSTQSDPTDLKDLAEDLQTPEGQKKLEETLKQLAGEDDETEESKRQKALDDAQQGAEGTEKQLGKQGKGKQGQQGQDGEQGQGQQGRRQPGQGRQGQDGQQGQGQQGQGQGQQGQDGQQGQGQQGQDGQQGQGRQGSELPMPGQGSQQGSGAQGGKSTSPQDGSPGPGSHHDVGSGDHRGSTNVIGGDGLQSRARGKLNKGQPLPGGMSTFGPGRAGGTANQRGTGDLRTVGPNEVDGIERSDVPQEYRDHVRQYFQP